MLKSLYNHFVVLYHKILPTNPTIASEHSLRQEQEVYEKSNKLSYRNAVISSIASLKRRDIPQSIGDPAVGTEGDLAARIEAKKGNTIPSTDAFPPSNVPPFERGNDHLGVCG